MSNDEIIKLYSRLISLKENLPEQRDIHEKYIREYHEIVEALSELTGSSLDEFKVPKNELRPIIKSARLSIPYLQKGGIQYSSESYCDRHFLLSKLDALLSYFKIKYLSKGEPQVGFSPPEN